MISAAYTYDREHKISEKLFTQGIETIDIAGKRGVGIANSIFAMADGKVGRILNGTACWLVDGVTGGIHEGVGEGMVMLGNKKVAERQ